MTNAPGTTLVDVSPELLEQWLNDNEAILIDIREDAEHANECIPAAKHVPMGSLDPDALRVANPDTRVVFHCHLGGRSSHAAMRFYCDDGPVYHLAGGIEAWKASGRGVNRPSTDLPINPEA